MSNMAQWLVSSVQACLDHSYSTHKLPSVIAGEIWRRFHQLRCQKEVVSSWKSQLSGLNVPKEHRKEWQLTLQLLMDEIIEKLLKSQADSLHSDPAGASPPLKIGEENAIRYMAGYVAVHVKLLLDFQKPVKQPVLQTKYNMFVAVLKGMRADGQPDIGVGSLSQYTTLWSELIDRGGIYHVSDEVCTNP